MPGYTPARNSLPGEDPAVNIDFDTSRARCEAKGHGWHLSTNAEWAAIALWCKKNGFMPYGNNNYGKDTRESNYKAIPTSTDSGRTGRVATGTGPLTWSHDKTMASTSIVLVGHTLLSASMERSKFAIVMSSLSYSMLQRITVTSPMSSGFLSLCTVVFWFMPSPFSAANGVQIPGFYYSKYQNVVHAVTNTEGYNVTAAYSLPGEDPAHDINFDTARARCEAKGHGWHLSTNAEWAAMSCRGSM